MMRPSAPWRSPAALGAAFIAVLLVSHRLFRPLAGFYQDDWLFLEILRKGGGLWGGFARYVDIYKSRPVDIVQMPLAFWLADGRPWAGQLLMTLLEAAEAGLLFAFALRLTGRRGLAWSVAILALLYPGRPVLHVWLSISCQLVAHILLLASLLLFAGGRRGPALALYAAGALCYESVVFLPAMLWPLLARRLGPRRGAAALWPYAIAAALVVFWQTCGMRWFLHASNPKQPAPELGHILKVFASGFECIIGRVFNLCARSAWPTLAGIRPGYWLAGAAFSGAIAWGLGRALSGRARRREIAALLGAAALVYVCGYLPYSLSGGYVPTMYGAGSRVNGTAAWAFGLLWTAALALWPGGWRAWPRLGLCAVLAAGLTLANWRFARDYSASWAKQRQVLAAVAEKVRGIAPGPATVILTGPTYAGQAVIFDAPYDFGSALRLSTGRADLRGDVASWRLHFEKNRVVERPGAKVELEFSYDALYLFNSSDGSFRRLTGPPDPAWLYPGLF